MQSIKIALAIALAAIAGASQAAETKVTFTTGMDYSSGSYGGTEDTDILYIPVVGKYETGPWTLKLTVPYLRITAPSGGTVVSVDANGRMIRKSVGPRTTYTGMGDVVAGLIYNLLNDTATQTIVDVTGKIKFGTADEAKWLGTGKDDYAVQTDAYKSYGKTTALATLGYRWMGDPAGMNFENVWYGSVGGVYKFSGDTSSGLILDLRQPTTATGPQMRELTAYMTQKLGGGYKLQLYGITGFTDASPDWGMGAMISISY